MVIVNMNNDFWKIQNIKVPIIYIYTALFLWFKLVFFT